LHRASISIILTSINITWSSPSELKEPRLDMLLGRVLFVLLLLLPGLGWA
jgi:hypothetical protein